MHSISKHAVRAFFKGKSVAIVGSGPGALDNVPGVVDSRDIVVRVNNYKTTPETGKRCDAFYSFFGGSIKKSAQDLKSDGVKMCLCKCPDAKFMESDWHKRMGKEIGTDFRYIYRQRAGWWFCDTFVPTVEEFVASFKLLNNHIPSTGFSALLLIQECEPKSIYLTGFDFFASRIHNVNEPWRPGNPEDPIGHAPELERAWLAANCSSIHLDARLTQIMQEQG